MKSLKPVILSLVVVAFMVIAAFGVFALDTAQRIRAKFKQVQTAINTLARERKPVVGVMASVIEFKKYLDAGDAVRAEATLDAILRRKEIVSLPSPPAAAVQNDNAIDIAVQAANEPVSDAFKNAQLVEIVGYSDHAMEPCITPDGKYLLFNNSNDPAANTRIHLTRRVDKNKFQYVGVLSGTVSGSKDMAPSIDLKGNFYFTSLRTYDNDMNSLYIGRFDGSSVRNVLPVSGSISPTIPCWINMDCCASEDGDSLIVSRARFDLGSIVPSESDLLLFQNTSAGFKQHPHGELILRNVNSPALEYAPSLSADQLTLYFTRGQELPGKRGVPVMRILMAKRKNLIEPFSKPEVIRAITGFVEAPTLPTASNELFYHKMENGRFRIFRCDKSL